VGEEGQPLSTYDFASDAKPVKKSARLMMQMAGEINDQWIGKVESERADRVRVSCATCHHGQPVPRSIQATVQAVLAEQGLEAAVQKYRELRRDSYGRDTFDFGEPPLNQVARQLMAEKKTAEALALLELNAEFHPQSAQVAALRGEAHLAAGDRDQALASFRRALELDPQNERLRKRIEELEKPAGR
jgi:tetratricopeptide (TPR) repeat protein